MFDNAGVAQLVERLLPKQKVFRGFEPRLPLSDDQRQRSSFEYPPGNPIRCNEWRVELWPLA